ncbi:MAG TPA: hypothetical protein VFF13_03780 [archaeon]|nr:hypothetical protein [archaeon]
MNKLHAFAFVLLISLSSLSAASEDNVPYVDIANPVDGSTVSNIVAIKFNAVGKALKNPFLAIEGSSVGQEFPVKNCTTSVEDGSNIQYMSCSYDWNSKGFEGQKIRISASVDSSSGTVRDSVGVLVSGKRI